MNDNKIRKPSLDLIQNHQRRGRVFDAPSHHWVYRLLPQGCWPYAQLARWDRPIGWQLLMWPCWWSVLLAFNTATRSHSAKLATVLWLMLLFAIGSIAMRGAGCTWNDLVDHKIDRKVERTRSRPLPACQVTRRQALYFMLAQCATGCCVLLAFNRNTIILGIASLVIVAIYPFMKRITNWPQLVLGLAFNWGALLGWSALIGVPGQPSFYLYVGSVLWTIGYDTIYAHQDKEDDALVGIGSTAQLFGQFTKIALMLFYSGFILFTLLAIYLGALTWPAYVGLAVAAIHLAWQIIVLDIDNQNQCLRSFKTNSLIGIYLTCGFIVSALLATA